MKRFLPILLLTLMLVGCTSLSQDPEKRAEQLREAMVAAVTEASEAVPATLYESLPTIDLLPEQSRPLLYQSEIPLLQENLELWRTQVIQAFRRTSISFPDLLKPYIAKLEIEDPEATLRSSDDSVSALLSEQFGNQIVGSMQLLLAEELAESQETYDSIYDRYSIWSDSLELLGEPPLETIARFPTAHLATLFVQIYLDRLAAEESAIRTTPVPQGTGSVYEIFQQELLP
jgi:hypothetical protein